MVVQGGPPILELGGPKWETGCLLDAWLHTILSPAYCRVDITKNCLIGHTSRFFNDLNKFCDIDVFNDSHSTLNRHVYSFLSLSDVD